MKRETEIKRIQVRFNELLVKSNNHSKMGKLLPTAFCIVTPLNVLPQGGAQHPVIPCDLAGENPHQAFKFIGNKYH